MKKYKVQIAAVAAAAMLAVTVIAAAQPAGGPGHRHGPPGGGMEVEHVLFGLKDKLNLDTSQQLAWTSAIEASKAAHGAMRTSMQSLHDTLAAELAKTTPDLAAVAAAADSAHASNQTLRQAARKQWLQIYANLRPDQVAIVRDALTQKLARMDAMRVKMQQRMQNGGAPSGS